MKRFVIQHSSDYGTEDFHFEFTMENTGKAIKAFRTLYGQAAGYTLYEQVAVTDIAGPRTEADNTNREGSVFPPGRVLDNLSGE